MAKNNTTIDNSTTDDTTEKLGKSALRAVLGPAFAVKLPDEFVMLTNLVAASSRKTVDQITAEDCTIFFRNTVQELYRQRRLGDKSLPDLVPGPPPIGSGKPVPQAQPMDHMFTERYTRMWAGQLLSYAENQILPWNGDAQKIRDFVAGGAPLRPVTADEIRLIKGKEAEQLIASKGVQCVDPAQGLLPMLD